MMRKIIFVVLSMIISGPVLAAGWDASKHRDKWGGGELQKCRGDEVQGSTMCIGSSAANDCKPLGSGNGNQATIMMIATTINESYAVFCPIQLDTELYTKKKNGVKKGTVYTLYKYPDRYSSTQCVRLHIRYVSTAQEALSSDDKTIVENKEEVLYKHKFEGLQKRFGTQDTWNNPTCDGATFFRDTYAMNSLAPAGVENIEEFIGMFSANNADKCANDKGELEHDIVLGIVDWTPGGHGAFVQPLQVSAKRNSLKSDTVNAWVAVSQANGSQRKLACKIGYKANADGTNCEPIDITKCPMSAADMVASICQTQDKSEYDKTKHILNYNDALGCYVFTCLDPTYGFEGNGSYNCTKCVTTARQGVNPTNGDCVKCATGNIFSPDDTAAAFCPKAKVYTKGELQYGVTKYTETYKDVNKQCWTMVGDDYVNCVKKITNARFNPGDVEHMEQKGMNFTPIQNHSIP